jgi:adenylosuccinate lyase
MKANLKRTEEFLASEKIMLALVKTGMERQKAYGFVQRNALDAWVNQKSFRQLIEHDKDITKRVSKPVLAKCFDTSAHLRHVDTLFKRVGV